MILERILPYSKTLLKQAVECGDVVIDGTAGNGHDTLFLAQLVGDSGHVYSFDVQETAVENTKQRLLEHGVNHVTVVHDGHQHVKKYMTPNHQSVSAAIFNLGYLPGSDHSITTQGETTLTAIKEILTLLKVNGIIVLVVYHGHEQGKLEKSYLLEQLSQLDQKQVSVLEYRYLNQKGDAPFILALEKVKA
ncbi:MAG TPA: 16S rRNA (cytosine(1402)-N(4))-methyltransferase [Firmicutes bacterium]|nr:16S rRNA (cytosine(1402)-N(4))-methyltransferase [Bacillota bacterium]